MTCASFVEARPALSIGRADLRSALFVFLLAAFTLSTGLLFGPTLAVAKMRNDTLTIKTAKTDLIFKVEVAVDDADKARGLMFRRDVPAMTGMLFPYDQAEEITMWMKNTYVSLDMVFIRADGVVHRIAKRTEPFSERIVASEGKVTAVLEIAAGEADRLGIQAGDRVVHSHFKPAK